MAAVFEKGLSALVFQVFGRPVPSDLDEFLTVGIYVSDLKIGRGPEDKIMKETYDVIVIEFRLGLQSERAGDAIVFQYRKTGDGLQIDTAISEYIADDIGRGLDGHPLFLANQPVDPFPGFLDGKVSHGRDGYTNQGQNEYKEF